MSEMKTVTTKIKIDVATVFNQVIDFIDTCNERVEKQNEEDAPEFTVPRVMQTVDMKFHIISGYLEDIANARLTQTSDPQDPILQALLNLGVISEQEETSAGEASGAEAVSTD
jgi:flagellar capping protein FliD